MFELTHRRRIVLLVLGAAVELALASTGCVTHYHQSGEPSAYTVQAPPRSPAHGYVHRYRDAVLVFDRSWNGYWVRSHPDHYFHSNYYYRWQGGRWYRARDIQGPWVTIQLRALPSGLHAKGTSTQYGHERWGAVQERRDDRREAAQQERREIGGSRTTQRVAKASAVPGRGPAEPRETKVRKHEYEDEEHPADHRVR